MTTGVLLALALALAPRAADAHGYMTKPTSRSVRKSNCRGASSRTRLTDLCTGRGPSSRTTTTWRRTLSSAPTASAAGVLSRRRRVCVESSTRRPAQVAAVDQYSDCDGCSSRGYPGRNPWSAPGTCVEENTGIKATLQENPTGLRNTRNQVAVMGVCGVANSARLDYNKPEAGRYGYSPVEEYAPGETITVEWCAVHKSSR